MKTMCFKATLSILTVLLALCVQSVDGSNGNASGADVGKVESGLPKVEKDFSVIEVPATLPDEGMTFAAMIPPKSIKRIILLHDHGFDAEQRVRADPDQLFAEVIKSQVRSTPWGLDAMERTVAECLIVTKKGEVFKVTAVGFAGSPTAAVTGVLLYGKGFSRRFDFRKAPLECGPPN